MNSHPDFKAQQRAFFDKKYRKEAYGRASLLPKYWISYSDIATIFGRLGLKDETWVLDLGCGDDPTCLTYYSLSCCHVVGVDLSKQGLRIAGIRVNNGGFVGSFDVVVADAEHLPFKEGFFDLIVSMMMLEHVRDLPRTIAEASRVLTAGGRIMIYTINKKYPFRKIFNVLFPGYHRSLAHSEDRFFTIEDIANLFRSNGLILRENVYLFALITAVWDLMILPKLARVMAPHGMAAILNRIYVQTIFPLLKTLASLDTPIKRKGYSSAIIAVGIQHDHKCLNW